MDPLDAASLAEWAPVWIRTGDEPAVDWAIVERPFADPFFEQTADRAMRHPFNQVFARSTPLAVLQRIGAVEPPRAPDGFVFHMSRCGSTLVAQMLAALPSAIVLSEAQPLDALVHLHRAGRLSEDDAVTALRGAVGALARPRAGEERLFVKFHAWHVHELPLIARAFPATPWVFLFREPRAVLRSQLNVLGAEVFAGKPPDAADDAYAANVLAGFCEAALRHAQIGRSLFVDYARLPDAVFAEILPFFGVALDGAAEQRLRAASRRDTKRSGEFTARDDADPEPHAGELAAHRLDPAYEALTRRAARAT